MAEEAHPEAEALGSSQAPGPKIPVYEVGFHIVPTIADDAIGGLVEKIRTSLGEVEIIKEQFPTKMPLAYTVERSVAGKREKYNDAYFGWIKFASQREGVPTFLESLRGMKDVLRFLLIETVREDVAAPRRAIFSSDRLEGQTLKKPTSAPETAGVVSEEELDKSIEALVQ